MREYDSSHWSLELEHLHKNSVWFFKCWNGISGPQLSSDPLGAVAMK